MKAWRVVSLTLWSIVLFVLLLVSGIHYLLTYTVLNQSRATDALHQTTFYATVRDQTVLPALRDQITVPEGGAVLRSSDVTAELNRVFTVDKVEQISGELLKATYTWLDKKTPSIEFTVSLKAEKQALRDGLATQIRQNVATLPVCNSLSDIPDNLETATCLPPYGSRDQVSEEAVTTLDNRLREAPDTLTPEVLGMTRQNLGTAMSAPDYIGYLWALNLITLPLALLAMLYLLLKRHGAGLIAVGSSIFVIGAVGLAGNMILRSSTIMTSGSALTDEIIKASKLLLEPTLLLAGGVGIGLGALCIIGGIVWHRASRD